MMLRASGGIAAWRGERAGALVLSGILLITALLGRIWIHLLPLGTQHPRFHATP